MGVARAVVGVMLVGIALVDAVVVGLGVVFMAIAPVGVVNWPGSSPWCSWVSHS